MTVKELKKELNKFDENLEVLIDYFDIKSFPIVVVLKSKPCKEDDEEGEELNRNDVVWLSCSQ
jgi:hypothetical protein